MFVCMKYEIWNVSIPISQQTKIEGINLESREMKCMFEIEMYELIFEIWNMKYEILNMKCINLNLSTN